MTRREAQAELDQLMKRRDELTHGHTTAEIATELLISPGTAKTHVANIQRKLDVRNRVGIAAWAWDTGAARP